MNLKSVRISPQVISQLTDWEILSALTFCSKVLKQETKFFKEEFYELCLCFFEGDEATMIEIIEFIKNLYFDEFTKRHSN